MSEHIYNVTVVVNPEVEERWLKWMREEHIPNVMETGLFSSFLFTQVFPEQEQDHPSYSIQYRAADLESIKLYMQMYADELRAKSAKAWGEHALAFRTVLEVLDENE
jgi:antibiotic biosynthesis monooxygenase (ABM) superfamily enzyme